jgi:hypothetical protein
MFLMVFVNNFNIEIKIIDFVIDKIEKVTIILLRNRFEKLNFIENVRIFCLPISVTIF